MKIYCIVTVLVNIISLLVFRSNIRLSIASIVPAVVIALLTLWSFFYNEQKSKKEPGDTSYTVSGERFSEEEQKGLYECLSKAFHIMIPFCIPFVFFFFDFVKVCSVGLYFFGIIFGRIMFNKKYSAAVRTRIEKEKNELESQIKKEENGRF